MSEVQNQQPGGQQQAKDAAGQIQDTAGQVPGQAAGQAQDIAGQTVKGVQDAIGGLTANQEQDGERGNEGALGGVTDQAQDAAGQATEQAGQVVGQASDVVGGLIGGGQGTGQGAGQSGEQEMDDYSYSDSDAETVENDKTPKGILGQLLNLDILPPPQSDTTTLSSGDSAEYEGPEEAQQ